MAKKIAIINSECRLAKKKSYVESVVGRLKKDAEADVVFTEYPGHAEKIASDSSHYEVVVAVGGDGTISQVVNGMDLQTQTLAVVPFGSANSFCRDLRITSSRKAFTAIEKSKTINIDLINCQFKTEHDKFKRYIIATSGLGFASATAVFCNRHLKKTGAFCYSLAACFKAFNQERFSAKIKIDDSSFEEIEFTNFLINNTKHAGNTCVFPKANVRDSRLNLLFAKTNVLTQYLWNSSVSTRTYLYYPNAKTAKRLHIILNKPSTFMLDGETFESVKEIRFTVTPHILKILT